MKEGKEEKKEEVKESVTSSSSSFSLMFGQVKLTKAQKKYKNYKKSLKKIKNKNIRANIIYFYELTQSEDKEFKQKYSLDQILLGEKKIKIFLEFYNKIKEIINSTDIDFINQHIFEKDIELYKLDEKEEKISKKSNEKSSLNKSNNSKNRKIENKKGENKINENKNNEENKIEEEKVKEIGPIKHFWKISLINCQFFYISKRDAEILNYLEDIIFIPLDYPNYKIEFHFQENEFSKQKVFYKEYYYTNYKKEKLGKSMGCDIDWEDDDKNPTLKISKKKLKEINNNKKKKNKKVKEESPYINCKSFFNMFDIDKCTIEKDFIEANFFLNDFLPNILEYYLNIIEIKYENDEDELLSNNL